MTNNTANRFTSIKHIGDEDEYESEASSLIGSRAIKDKEEIAPANPAAQRRCLARTPVSALRWLRRSAADTS